MQGLGEFVYNKKNRRFLVAYTIAYVNVGIGPELTDANSDTPSIGIGKCFAVLTARVESNSRTVMPKHQVKPTTTKHQNTEQNS